MNTILNPAEEINERVRILTAKINYAIEHGMDYVHYDFDDDQSLVD